MLQEADLDAAVSEGIVTAEQAAALRGLAQRRERERAVELGHEERFRFMRGFNDVFFAIGVVLFVAGFLYFTARAASGFVLTAAVVWGLAEVLVARLRLVLPGILLASAFVVLVFLAATPVPLESGLPFETRPMFPPSGLLDYLHFYPGGPLAFAGRALIAAANTARPHTSRTTASETTTHCGRRKLAVPSAATTRLAASGSRVNGSLKRQ